MPLLPALLLMAQTVSSQSIDVPILNVRPSRLLAVLTQLPATGAKVVANDEKSTLTLTGSATDINEIRTRIGLFDVKPQMVSLNLCVASPIDHAEWKASLTLSGNRKWTGSDESTGATLIIVPRRNDDGTITLVVEARTREQAKIQSVVRLKIDESVSLGLPLKGPAVIGGPGALEVNGLRITLTAVDPSKKG